MVEFIISVVICFLLFHIIGGLASGSGVIVGGLAALARLICIIAPIYFFFSWMSEDDDSSDFSGFETERVIIETPDDEDDENSATYDGASDGSSGYDNSGTSVDYYQVPSTPPIERTPIRNACRACRQTGRCTVCRGTGQQVSAMSLVTDETVYEDCKTCGGSGTCHACGGDGYLDEGVDF